MGEIANKETRIGVLGTGIMGAPMTQRLAAAGFPTTIWNRSPGKAQGLRLPVAASASACAADADIVVCVLSSGPVCDEILLGEGGTIAGMRPGSALVVTSSIPVATARRQAEAARLRGVDYVDAPLSGGEKGAQAGTLAIMAAGAGSLAKLANQAIVASTICAVAEALLGDFADSTILNIHGRRMIEGNFVAGGSVRNQRKDTEAALEEARGLGLDLPLLRAADTIFGKRCGGDGYDLS